LTSENGFALAPWRITVSTAGVVPSIEKLIAANLGVRLAVSLNHYSNPKRDRIMPINKKYPIEQVMEASRRFAKTSRYGVTFEYVVNEGDNDGPDAINALVKMMHDIKCKVNLIPLNPAGSHYDAPEADIARIDAFSKVLYERGITATVRKSRGKDICGACGQLAGRLKNAD
jgi:23S rRNA (adenine2503-C2)-methyltransferase